ncbi:hypothetical protein ACFLTB_04965 [Chloroflexota bacterium]
MILHTTSEVISLAKNLESESARIYEELSEIYEQDKNIFLAYSSENSKNIKQIERVYYGTISDAIEGTFAFNLESDNYSFREVTKEASEYPVALEKAVTVEKLIIKFYFDAAAQSESLLADVQRIFTLMARKRAERIEKLGVLLDSTKADI